MCTWIDQLFIGRRRRPKPGLDSINLMQFCDQNELFSMGLFPVVLIVIKDPNLSPFSSVYTFDILNSLEAAYSLVCKVLAKRKIS